jgi:hypothetical protein
MPMLSSSGSSYTGCKAGGKAAPHLVVAGAGRRAPSGHPSGRPAGLLRPAVLESVRERAQITDLFGPAELKKSGRDFVTWLPDTSQP